MKKFLYILFFIIGTAYGEEKVLINFDCYLPNAELFCIQLQDSYLKANKGFEIAPIETAYFSVIIRAIELNNTIEYQFNIVGNGNLPSIKFPYPLNRTLTNDEQKEKVLSMLNKLTDPFKLILNYQGSDTPESEKPGYFQPEISAMPNKGQGNTSFVGSLSGTYNYSTTKYRIYSRLESGGMYNSQDTNAFNKGITTKVFYIGGNAGYIYSFTDHWDIAVMAEAGGVNSDIKLDDQNIVMPENALNNTATKEGIKTGIEWILVPFITDKTNGNIAIRFTVGGEHHRYVDPETFLYIEEAFMRESLEIAVAKHFKKIDVAFKTSAFSSTFRTTPTYGLSVGSEVTYRINNNLTLGGSFQVDYVQGRIPSPAASNSSFSGLTSGNKASVQYSGRISLKYTIGNGRLNGNEQRWK